MECGKKFYEKVAEKVKEWGEYTKVDAKEGYSLVGAVVGAIVNSSRELMFAFEKDNWKSKNRL